MKSVVRLGFSTVIAVLVAGTATAAADIVVKGDAKGWSEIKAAWGKLPTLKSYRFKIVSKEMSGTMTVVAPDRLQMIMSVDGATSESITVGQNTRFRQGNGAWQCGPSGGVTDMMRPEMFAIGDNDDTGVREEVTVSKGATGAIEGVQTQSYSITIKRPDEVERTRLFIETASGLPKRIEMLDETGAVTQTVTVSDVNTGIQIALPACR